MGDFVGFRGGRRGALSGDDFGDRVRGCPILGQRMRERAGTVADFGCGGGRYRLRSTSHGAIFSDLSVHAVGAFGCAVCGGEKEKGSSDAEDAIG